MNNRRNNPTAYVLNGYSSGGAHYMDYHVGWVLNQHFNFECKIVQDAKTSPFVYPKNYDKISMQRYYSEVSDCDITIATAGASSLELPNKVAGKTLMYVQGCLYANLDGFYDHYVYVSDYVKNFYSGSSNLGETVIPAFVETELVPDGKQWADRNSIEVAVIGKFQFDYHVTKLQQALNSLPGGDRLNLVPLRPSSFWSKKKDESLIQKLLPKRKKTYSFNHEDVFNVLSEFRYATVLSQSEGFGIMPLEAMACGCSLVGFHGGGGKQYMIDGVNCEFDDYPNIFSVARRLIALTEDDARAQTLSRNATETAQRFNRKAFDDNWVTYFKEILN